MRCQFLFKFPSPRNNLTEHIIGYYSQRKSILFYFPMTWVLYHFFFSSWCSKFLFLRMHVCVPRKKEKVWKNQKKNVDDSLKVYIKSCDWRNTHHPVKQHEYEENMCWVLYMTVWCTNKSPLERLLYTRTCLFFPKAFPFFNDDC